MRIITLPSSKFKKLIFISGQPTLVWEIIHSVYCLNTFPYYQFVSDRLRFKVLNNVAWAPKKNHQVVLIVRKLYGSVVLKIRTEDFIFSISCTKHSLMLWFFLYQFIENISNIPIHLIDSITMDQKIATVIKIE